VAEYWVDNATGSNANSGAENAPWATIPGQPGANAVVAGDIINVRNGRTYPATGRLILPANNLTYRGYGLAENVLTLELPVRGKPWLLQSRRIVRQAGVHEGMWTLDGAGETSQGILNYSTRTGCVIEDCRIINATASATSVVIGASNQAGVGATLRRSAVLDGKAGILIYRPDTLIEDCLVRDIADDGIVVGTTATQSLHSGRWNTIRRVNLLNCGTDTVADIGDPFQLLDSDGYAGALVFADSLIRRNAQVKQAIMLGTVNGTVSIVGVHFDGERIGTIQVGLYRALAAGRVQIRRSYWKQVASNGNPYVRMVAGGLATGSELTIADNIVDATSHAGLFSWGPAVGTLDGVVTVRGNTVLGIADNGLSWSAAISGQTTTATIGANAQLIVENNILSGASPVAIRLPTGGLNDARFPCRNNVVFGATNAGYVGAQGSGTAYATVAAFEAAHSQATGNLSADPALRTGYRLAAGSPALGAGRHTVYTRDITGVQRPKPPSIGAFDRATLRPITP